MRLRGDRPPPGLTAALDRSSRYLASLVGNDDPDPRYGDDDDGFALRLGVRVETHRARTPRNRGSGRRQCQSQMPTGLLRPLGYAASLGNSAREAREAVAPEVEAGVYAKDGGLVVLRSGRRRLTMDVGPLGYLSIAAHGHADALAVTLSSEGHDLIVDPGTASYYGNPAWRSAHRSTRAHPTVCVDGLDQSVDRWTVPLEPGTPTSKCVLSTSTAASSTPSTMATSASTIRLCTGGGSSHRTVWRRSSSST